MAFDDPFNTNDTLTGDSTANNFYNLNEQDPAAEFLAREREELGDITGNADINSFNADRLTNGAHSPMVNVGDNVSSNRNPSPYEALSQYNEQMNEPEKIQRWREEFAARITKKDADEEIKRAEMREQAKKELDDFYKQRVEQMERVKGENSINNRALEDALFKNGDVSTSNEKVIDWEKITSLCEFNPKTTRSQKDLTRYRSVLLQLKQQQQITTK